MGRLLDEDDVIDAISKILSERCGGNTVWWKPVAEAVANNLPSTQPNYGDCTGCKHLPRFSRKTPCGNGEKTRRDMRGKQDDYEKKDIPLNTDDIFNAELAKRILNNK